MGLSYSREEQAALCEDIAFPLYVAISWSSVVVSSAPYGIGGIGKKVKSKISGFCFQD